MAQIFVEGWDPEYGTPLDQDLAPAEGSVDPTVERDDWEPLEGVDDGVDRVAFVDGVRRVDARLTLDDPVSGPTPGLVGTFAVGATVWDRTRRRSTIEAVRIERWAVLAGGRDEQMPPVDLEPGVATTTCASEDPGLLMMELHTKMRRAEGETATALAAECFVVADGPLNDLTAHPTVGYVKSHRVTYLEPDRNAIVAQLAPGQRTPMFCIADYKRYSWYVRLAVLQGGHSLDGHRAVRGVGPAAQGPSRDDRRPNRRPVADRRLRTACRSARAAEPGAHRRPREGTPPPHGRSGPRVPGTPRSRRPSDGARVVSEQPPNPQVGRVLGSDHSSTSAFRVVLDESEFLQLDDLVVVRTQVPKAGEIRTYGVVTEAEAVYEGASYESDTHRIAELGIMPAAKVRTAKVDRSRASTPRSGSPPTRARPWTAPKATNATRRSTSIRWNAPCPPASGATNGRSTSTSTSSTGARAATCRSAASAVSPPRPRSRCSSCACSPLASTPASSGKAPPTSACWCSTSKARTCLWLDKPNRFFDEDAAAGWAALGVEPTPFPSVCFWAPPKRRSGDVLVPDTGGRLEGVEVFTWTPREFIDEDLLSFLLTDANDQRNQIPFIRDRVQAQLKRFAVDVAGMPGAVVLRDPRDAPAGSWRGQQVSAQAGERIITDLQSLVDALGEFLEPDTGDEPDVAWSGRVMGGTVSAFMRRLHAGAARMGSLVRAGESRRIDRARASVTVVAIQSLHEQAQRFVVGALLNETFAEKEATGQRLPLSVVVLDELNKYAPREGHSPLKEMLVDIAQRGRSLGVLLVGAQQTASRVAGEVLENAAIRVSGRLDAAEAERAEYGWMLPSTRARARLLKPGTMVVSQPAIPVPLVVTFPFPPWATRKEEVATQAGDDPFAGL